MSPWPRRGSPILPIVVATRSVVGLRPAPWNYAGCSFILLQDPDRMRQWNELWFVKANPILLINIKREDVFRIHLTNILWMRCHRHQSQITCDLGFAYCSVLLCEGNIYDISSWEKSTKFRDVGGYHCHMSIIPGFVVTAKKKERFIWGR